MLCSICNKNTAVIFINKQLPDNASETIGYCYDCAKKKGINPIEALTKNANISADYAESSLFDNTKVHTVNLLISDENWNDLIANALDEKYVTTDVEIDGELIQNVAIRTKGNSSLKAVQRADSERFSFKIEFDHNDKATTYHGLDKLSLNNLGQDISCMKDFMSYTMFNDMGIAAPLTSYSVLQKNGEDFGLYLSVEAIEDSFRIRNYGKDDVDLYKPEIFDLNKLATDGMTDRQQLLQTISGEYYADKEKGDRLDILYDLWGYVFTPEFAAVPSLKYIGDNAENYSALWDSSVFKCTDEDKQSYIESVKILNSDDGLSVIDTDSVIRYMVVHNFVNNTDSHSTMFCHNFYICNHKGKLSYVPWDYNAAFGGFNFENIINSIFGEGFCIDMRPDLSNAMDTDVSFVNYPIDTPYFSISPEDRPIFNAILTDKNGLMTGILTDGDIRRTLIKENDVHTLLAKDAMTKNPKTILENDLAAKALHLMEQYSITTLAIVDKNIKPIGVLHIHDLLKAGVA